jgi:U3 small nucleolar RNA-associated protein 13
MLTPPTIAQHPHYPHYPSQMTALLTYLRNWNTQAKYALVSQALLNVLLKSKGTQGLLALPNAGKGLIEPLLAYTQRHFDHASELLQASFLLDFALFSMAE